MRQAELELADPEQISFAKFGTRQIPHLAGRGEGLTRREIKHSLTPKHQQAVIGFDRRMPQDQVVIFAATNANDGPIVLEANRAENAGMVNEFKHRALRLAGAPRAVRGLR